jgi:hypothetical protein
MTGASLGKATRGANAGIEPVEVILLWCAKGAGTVGDRRWIGARAGKIALDTILKVAKS